MEEQKKIRVAINGFGRIGRAAFKIGLDKPNIEFVAINDLTEPKVLASLLKYDTAYGRFGRPISFDEKNIIVDGQSIPVIAEKDPAQLPWKDLNVDVVIESTGRFVKDGAARAHLEAGAKRVVISAPAKGGNVETFLFGVNHDRYGKQEIISNASCTTNCISPVINVLYSAFGVSKALMDTVHSYTAEQNLVDGPPPGGHAEDLRRARAAAQNIVPTTTGAAIATTEVIPELAGVFDGVSLRVPTITGSIANIVAVLKRPVTVEEVQNAFKEAAEQPFYKGILEVSDEPLVSSDIRGTTASAIVDLPFIRVVGGDLVSVLAWYDNEWGYSNRLVEQVELVGKSIE
jgi:glyceraldehyde 3-phosphate dehydrogenase